MWKLVIAAVSIVEVHSHSCDNGMYGARCLKLCSDRNCLVETSTCNHINGTCQGGCKEGCSGIKRCEEGVYGEECSKKCLDRKCKDSNLQCDSKKGECIDGCQPGYQSIDCTQGSKDQSSLIGTIVIGLIIGLNFIRNVKLEILNHELEQVLF